jgi:hypothetical protein
VTAVELHAIGTGQSAGDERQVSSQHLYGVSDGQLAGVLHVVRSVVQLPSGQGTFDTSGRFEGGSGGHAETDDAQLVSRHRTGVDAGQMNPSGHCESELTHSEPTDASGHAIWFAAQLIGCVPLQLPRQEPSTHRAARSGQVTCVGQREVEVTHSPPEQRIGAAAAHCGTLKHC